MDKLGKTGKKEAAVQDDDDDASGRYHLPYHKITIKSWCMPSIVPVVSKAALALSQLT
jgi:hypothetical protein